MRDHQPADHAAEPVPTGLHAWLVLWKATHAVEECAHASIEETGLGRTDFAILESLLHKGPLPVSVLGKKVLLTTGSITTAVDRLVKRGLVGRHDDPADRRVRRVQLTAAGRRVIKPAFARHEEDVEEVVSVLKPRERAALVALLRKLGRHAEAIAAGRAGDAISEEERT
jgi:MarR family 2-MHQ and catechol resistance regulon transcriptional repressor